MRPGTPESDVDIFDFVRKDYRTKIYRSEVTASDFRAYVCARLVLMQLALGDVSAAGQRIREFAADERSRFLRGGASPASVFAWLYGVFREFGLRCESALVSDTRIMASSIDAPSAATAIEYGVPTVSLVPIGVAKRSPHRFIVASLLQESAYCVCFLLPRHLCVGKILTDDVCAGATSA